MRTEASACFYLAQGSQEPTERIKAMILWISITLDIMTIDFIKKEKLAGNL
jgi:hypothetical protein